jgi:hypothetical protein
MADNFTPVMRALVAAALLLAIATLMLVAVNTARAAGSALAIGTCGSFGKSYDFLTAAAARKSAPAKCTGSACRVVASVQRGCAALAID